MKAEGKMKEARIKNQERIGLAPGASSCRLRRRNQSSASASLFRRLLLGCALLSFVFSIPVGGQWTQHGPQEGEPSSTKAPSALEDVGIDQRLNEQVPLDLGFRDEIGRTVRLSDYFGDKPVVLALVYYSCPMLCNQVLNGMTGALIAVKFDAGKDFTVVAVSFDPRERPYLAVDKKAKYVDWYNRPGAAESWHFLTGDQASIDRLTQAVGFRYTYDSKTNQFAHASGIMLLTPRGKLARYFYGIEYAPKDVQLGLVEASGNKIGSPVDRLLLYCYHYDPASGKYAPVVINLIRAGGVVTIAGMIALLLILRRRGTHAERAAAGGVV